MTVGKLANVAAVVLAGGVSRRFGRDNKLLVSVDGEPLVRRVVSRMLASRVGRVIVVTGHENSDIEAALAGLPVDLVHNARFLEGMGFTVAAGIRALDPQITAVLIAPGDLPNLSVALVDRLIGVADAAGFKRIVFPATLRGEQRNPVIWPRRYFAELGALTGDKGARDVIHSHADAILPVPVDDDGFFIDIDRPEDLAAWQKARQGAPR